MESEDVWMKNWNWPKHSILLVAVVATWLQTYLTYQTSFDLDIENFLQQIILFLNPLAFLLFFYGFSLFFKTSKGSNRYIVATKVILSIVLYGNVLFYRFYSDFITIPVLFQTNNFGDLGNSVTTLINWTDIWYFFDLIVILIAIKYVPKASQQFNMTKSMRKTYFALSFAILFLNWGLAEAARPQLLTRSFDRDVLVKNLGTYNYHLYDVYVQSKSNAQRALADGSEVTDVSNYAKARQAKNDELFGLAKGRNVIIISVESTQNFVINRQVNGQDITPFLNELTKDKDTLYFNNFYHQTGLGKTSDAEFIVENSLYGTNRGAVFFTNASNQFQSMANRFNEAGYSTNVFHANTKSFWNRDMMYQSLGIQKFYDVESYEVNDDNSVNWGLKDIPFLEQSADLMTHVKQPFYARMLTLSNHFPFVSDKEDQLIDAYDSGDQTVDQYFQTVRYTDEALKVFFESLKEKGLYDNSMIIMYGDHYGISENHNKAMAKYLEKDEITPFDSAHLQQVPFFIHIPHSDVKQKVAASTGADTTSEVSGELDIRPTVLHLVGMDTKNDIQIGTDLLSKDHDDFIVFRDGRFITKDFVYAAETCYDRKTGEELDVDEDVEDGQNACTPLKDDAQEKLSMSDKVINGDLLRFYDYHTGKVK